MNFPSPIKNNPKNSTLSTFKQALKISATGWVNLTTISINNHKILKYSPHSISILNIHKTSHNSLPKEAVTAKKSSMFSTNKDKLSNQKSNHSQLKSKKQKKHPQTYKSQATPSINTQPPIQPQSKKPTSSSSGEERVVKL